MAILALTSVHHVYGAYIYKTPWRLHVVLIAAPTAAVLAILLRLTRRQSALIARAAFVALTALIPVAAIGIFEGGYNHTLKLALYFSGAPVNVMHRFFPPPMYESPNDVFFEVTGVLQFVLGLIAARQLFALLRREPGKNRRIHPSDVITPRDLVTIAGETVPLPDRHGLVHLQFRRFAGCPVCDLHLRSIVQRHGEIVAAGVREVVLFHSPDGELRRYAAELPFAVVADPDKRLYEEFGVESSPRALLDPRAWPVIVRAVGETLLGMARGRKPAPSLNPHGGRFGLPADFLIDRDGRVVACKYGEHAADHWSVDEILALARSRAVAPSPLVTRAGVTPA